jgi:hypothetical protein
VFENLDTLLAGALVLLGVAQAVIGMMTKFGLKGLALLGSSAAVLVALSFATYYGWEYVPVRLVLIPVFATLAAGGYWRYRNGSPVEVPADDPEMTTV